MTPSEMTNCLKALYLQWPNMVIDRAMVKLWYMAFPEVERDRFLKAIIAVLKSSGHFCPTIGDVSGELDAMRTREIAATRPMAIQWQPPERADPIPEEKMQVFRAQIANLCKKKAV